MQTTDFTGTYDYEKEEALCEANYLIEQVEDGSLSLAQLPLEIESARIHWRKSLNNPESFADFDAHFTATLNAYMEFAK
jgi:hypothetical protein